jgi:negative regulator of sigma E activity
VDCWATYHLIGDALRETCTHRANLQTKIYAQLAAEPTVLAPQPSSLGDSAGLRGALGSRRPRCDCIDCSVG